MTRTHRPPLRAAASALLFISSMLLAGRGARAQTQNAAPKGKILVVLSSENKITLKDGATHPTGFFFPELMGPLKKLVAAGYVPVFANPKGNKAVMDKISDGASWFGDAPNATPDAKAAAQKEYQDAKALCLRLGICGDGLVGSKDLERLSQVIADGLDQYAGIFVPGGHAPMEDLWKDPDLGTILRHFHAALKPTALICHGPIALLSAMDHPRKYVAALTRNNKRAMASKAQGWIYQDYSATIFTTAEEQQNEPGQNNALGGYVRFYPDQALENAGAHVQRAAKWNSNVVQDRELITGQNPMSEEALGDALVRALDAKMSRE